MKHVMKFPLTGMLAALPVGGTLLSPGRDWAGRAEPVQAVRRPSR